MNRNLGTVLTAIALLATTGGRARAHCQVPCGIYDDATRFTLMLEHVTTIEKSMAQITSLSAEAKPEWNQIVRWVDNKEAHADKLAEIVTYYFMAQRVKPAPVEDKAGHTKYVAQVTLLHQMLVTAMKTKQTTDLGHTAELRKLIAAFQTSYMGKTPVTAP